MTVSTTTSQSGPFIPNGVTTVFPFSFRILDATHLQVVQVVDGVSSIISPSAYTVSGVGASGGGSVTFGVAPMAGRSLFLVRVVPKTQLTALVNQGPFYAETIERALDLAAMRDQDLASSAAQSWKAPIGQTPGVINPLPDGHFPIGAAGSLVDGGSAADIANAQANAASAASAAFAAAQIKDAIQRIVPGAGAVARLKRAKVNSDVFWVGTDGAGDGTTGVGPPGGGGGRTFVMKDKLNGCRQDGYVRTIRFRILSNADGVNNKFKAKLLRPNGASYDLIAESALTAISTGAGVKTFVLSPPLGPFREQDKLGLYLQGASFSVEGDGSATAVGSTLQRVDADATGGETYVESANYRVPFWGTGGAPVVVGWGDSIMGGAGSVGAYHYGCIDYPYGPAGNRNADMLYRTQARIPILEYQNFGVGGSTWAGMRTRLAQGNNTQAPVALLHCGINDVAAGRTWAAVQADMDACLAAFHGYGTDIIFLNEMLPDTNFSDALAATVRLWNGYYQTWADANGVILIKTWDTFGALRPSTGYKDNLLPAYDCGDGVHPSLAGYDKLGSLIAQAMLEGLGGGAGNAINAAQISADAATASAGAAASSATTAQGYAASINPANFATAAQGTKADTAVQPGSLGSAAYTATSAYATATQGAKADTAVQPGALGTAAYTASSTYATAAQGVTADSASQGPGVAVLNEDLVVWNNTGGKNQKSLPPEVTSFVPTITSQTGTITTVGTKSFSYRKVGNRVHFDAKFTITTNGTGAGSVQMSLPFTVAKDFICAAGLNSGVSCWAGASAGTTSLGILKYDGTYPAANGTTFLVSGSFQI